VKRGLCEICNEVEATQRHHIFSQTKINKKLYGALIDDPQNIQNVCWNCHIGEQPGLKRMTETEFCAIFKIEKQGKIYL
jgi:hypothetical protein